MTKPAQTVQQALKLHERGASQAAVSRMLGVSRAAIREWLADPEQVLVRGRGHTEGDPCPAIDAVPRAEYAYLLGQYLGDGWISQMRRDVYRLRVATCDDYPRIRKRVIDAMRAVMPANRVGVVQSVGCTEVYSMSKHWPCLFPQHGPGRKHEREIRLSDWQDAIVSAYPQEFLAGLIHSDGCRSINVIRRNGKSYEYSRYFFSNVSRDILDLCAATFDYLGVEWKHNRWNCLSVAKRESVDFLDTFIGPKT